MQVLGAVVRKNHALRADSSRPPNPGMLDRALERALQLASHDFLVVVVSDLFGVGPETKRFATLLARHNDVMVVFVHDRLETEMIDAGRVVVQGPEGQLELDTGRAGLRREFREDFAARVEGFRQVSRQRAIPLIPVQTSEGVAEQVRRHLGEAQSASGR